MQGAEQVAQRYVAWVKRHTLAIVAGHVLVLAGALYLIAFHLPLKADFSYLLPQDAPSVRDLRRLETRVKATDTALAIVTAPTSEARAAAMTELAEGIRALPPHMVERVDADDSEARAYLRAHRFLFIPLDELVRARDALERRIHDTKLAHNPLFIDLDDDKPHEDAKAKQELDELRAKRKEAEAKLDHPSNISRDGRLGMIQIRTSFQSTNAGLGAQLLGTLNALRHKIVEEHPGVDIGYTGAVVTAVAEHNAIFKGMVLSSLITTLLVAIVLALYFRSATLLVLLIGTLGLATAIAFGAAALTVGHLNAATAFLGAIIAGNGINYGILLIARYLEERRKRDPDHALAVAIAGTLRPTAVASLGAAIAYGSLAATSFKGFADFAVIGAIGMILCWVVSFLLLPALMLKFARKTRVYTGDPIVGSTLVRILGFRRSRVVCGVAAIAGIVATAIVVTYVARDPFEYDIKQLRSEGVDAVAAREWMQLSDRTFGRGFSGRTYIAADRLDQVPMIVATLRASDAKVPKAKQTFGSVNSLLDVVPEHQPEKLAVLAQIRTLLDDEALDALDDKERAELRDMRPPDDLAVVTPQSLPQIIREQLEEKDGRIGYLISIRPAPMLDEWNGHDLIRFAHAVRKLELPDGEEVTTSGSSVIFADIVEAITRDGPVVTLLAAVLLVVMVVSLVGANRRAMAVLAATAAGALLMVATCALLGIRVNFLDFVALPITLGIGVDYAINVAHRQGSEADPIRTLRTSGAAVFVCSLTTIIGYGSLLVSSNLAIRGFGTASLIGELSCVFTALVLVPALLAVRSQPAGAPQSVAA